MINKISLILVIISALIHPLWNMLLKRSGDKVIFYLNIHLIFTVVFSFILFVYPLKSITALGWVLIIVSACTHFFYQLYLCQTYESGDMSLTYPIIRSSPIFILILGVIFLKEIPSKIAVAGIAIVVFGAQIINQKDLSLASLLACFRNFDKKIIVPASLTAFFSACYSIVDKKAVLTIDPILFFYLFFSLSGLLFLAYLLSLKERRKYYFSVLNKDKMIIFLAAILEFASYILILFAFRISKVAYVVALRQLSIIFGTLYAIWFLREKCGKVRLAGSLIIFIGVFLITAFG